MRHFSLLMLSLCLVATTITGCGGSGGGGNESGPSLPYTGNNAPAMITDSNADTLAGTALYGTTANSMALSVSGDSGAQDKSNLNMIGFAQTLANLTRTIGADDMAASSYSNAMQTVEIIEDGSCGGSVAFNLTVDDETGLFSGKIVFSSYDECFGETISGQVTASGAVNPDTEELEELNINFTKLSVTSSLGSETLSGTVSTLTTGPYSYVVTCSMRYQVNSAATCKLDNLVMTFEDYGNQVRVSLSGRAYHPVEGYVELTTTTPLEIDYGNDYPHAGVIEMRGANGTGGGATKGVVTFENINLYSIEVDASGDGSVDNLLSCTWSPDMCTAITPAGGLD